MIEQTTVPVVALDAHTVSVDPGSEAALDLRVRNDGTIVDAFQVEVLGPAAAWTTVEPSTLRLFPNATERAVARFRPPRSWLISAGILTVGFRVSSSVDPTRASVEECELEIQPFCDVSAELRPRTSRGRLRGRHQLMLHSASNEPVEVALAGRDVDGDCAVEVRPERVTIGPGRNRRARVRVRPSYRPIMGPAMESYSFETTVAPAGGQESRLQGTMRQVAILPRGAVMLAFLAMLVLAGFVIYSSGLMNGLVKPLLIRGAGSVTTPSPTGIIVVAPTANGTGVAPTGSPGTGTAPATAPATGPPATAATGGGTARQASGWASTRPMGTAREQHTATVLADGRLLVAGGLQISGTSVNVLNSTELYDPATGAWTAAAPMAAGRAAQTATALNDGRILVAGGEAQTSAALSSVELYDPVANRWTAVAPLHTARFGHAAVLLANGRVLVAGGRTSTGTVSTAVASTEVYDPATNTWATGPDLSVPRSDLTLTKLKDDQVLAAGGDAAASTASTSPQAAADLIAPDGRSARRATSMATVRADHTATLLDDGRVLVVGGTLGSPRAEVYAPGTDRWTATAAPAAARRYHAAAKLPSGKVLVVGGAGTAALASAEIFDPNTNTWSATQAMSGPRWQPVMTALKNDQVIVTGGVPVLARTTPPLATAEVYG